MTVAFVNDAETTNGTAGTSVVVSRPSGTASGHVLLAFIACVGSATISTPSGWTLIGGANPGGSVRMNAFYRVADGTEPASWTWTLGASQRNLGWVGCYSGVKTSAPIRASQETGDTTAGTGFSSSPTIALATGGMGVSAVAAIRTAAGAATTWTGSGQNERADLSTNAGSGTDIAGMVQDSVYTGVALGFYGPTWTASQSMTAGAMWAVTLQAEFLAPTAGALISRSVEVAWGADPDGDPDDWTWTDITQDLLDEPGVIVETGRDERAAIDQPANPTKIDLRLRNWRPSGVARTNEGQYTPDNPNSPNYPNVVQRVPLRIVQPYGYTGETVRYTVFVDSWRPSWDDSGRAAFVDVTAFGRLQWIRAEGRPIRSALYRRILGTSNSGVTPHAYYPCEDGSGSSRVASAIPGHQPLQVSGPVSFAAASDLGGSGALPTMGTEAVLGGALGPAYAATGQWALTVALRLPETEPVSEQRLLLVVCNGTAREWSLWLVPGSPASLSIRADIFGTSLLDDSVTIVEADHYGQWRLFVIFVSQNGADVDYEAFSHGSAGGTGVTGTLAGRTIGSARTVRLVTFSGLSGMGVGHIALFTDPAFQPTDPDFIAFSALDGNSGDMPFFRFQRLCTEEDIPYDTDWDVVYTEIPMGPQRPGALGDLLQDAADSEMGMVHDATPDGSLFFTSRGGRYNQTPTVVLDGDLGQIPADVRPVFDGTGRITDSTVTRDGGSSARYADLNARGNKPDAKTLSLETDNHLYEIAGWRVALGNQPSMRYPSLPFNLRRNVDLVEDWFNSTIGSRMQATNMVTAHGPSDPDGIIVGWRETIRRDNWVVEPVLVSARPYDVPVLESGDDTTWRLDMEGSTLATAAGTSDTSLLVACSGDARWGTDVPYDLDVNGERMTATAVASSATDAFGRTSANGWGSADSGQAWTTANGSASDFAVSSGTGRITNNSTGVLRGVLLDIESLDVDFSVDLVFPNASAATAVYERWVIGRATDTSNHYGALLQLGTSGGALTLAAFKRVGGTFTNLASKSAGTNAAGNTWRATVRIVGEPGSTKLYVTAQNLTAGTPPVAVRVTDLDDATLTGTNIGVIDRRGTGNTDTGIVGQWDNLDVTMPQLVTVTRAVAGGANAKAHTAGETVRLWRARGLAL